eukprot:Hpha_TRINITY_DN14569_c0_g6::TRINITY_DN14569_c0_g6_i1::g.46793::m.46793
MTMVETSAVSPASTTRRSVPDSVDSGTSPTGSDEGDAWCRSNTTTTNEAPLVVRTVSARYCVQLKGRGLRGLTSVQAEMEQQRKLICRERDLLARASLMTDQLQRRPPSLMSGASRLMSASSPLQPFGSEPEMDVLPVSEIDMLPSGAEVPQHISEIVSEEDGTLFATRSSVATR